MHSHDSPQHTNPKRFAGSLLSDALRLITRLSSRSPRLTLCFVLLISCAAVGYTACCLKFHTQRSDLIDPEADFHKRWMEYTESFGDSSDIVVLVEGTEPKPIKHALEDLGGRLAREPELFTNLLFKADTKALRQKGLQYFRPEQLAAGLNRLTDYQSVVQGRWEYARLDYAVRSADYRLRIRPGFRQRRFAGLRPRAGRPLGGQPQRVFGKAGPIPIPLAGDHSRQPIAGGVQRRSPRIF